MAACFGIWSPLQTEPASFDVQAYGEEALLSFHSQYIQFRCLHLSGIPSTHNFHMDEVSATVRYHQPVSQAAWVGLYHGGV